jgi:hypothetical protein
MVARLTGKLGVAGPGPFGDGPRSVCDHPFRSTTSHGSTVVELLGMESTDAIYVCCFSYRWLGDSVYDYQFIKKQKRKWRLFEKYRFVVVTTT